MNHEDLILHPPQQGWGKVTCESVLRVRGRNRGYLCSHVIGAPAKCCTSGTAVNKAGEAAEPEWTAARGSRDLQPRSSQRGEGLQKAELPRGAGMPRLEHTLRPSPPPDSLLLCQGILCARGAEAGTCHRHMVLQFLEPLCTKVPERPPGTGSYPYLEIPPSIFHG